MKYRKLRIAWSVGCGVACLLLIALWVRSYWVYEGIVRQNKRLSEPTIVMFASNRGTVIFSRRVVPPSLVGPPDEWTYQTARHDFATTRRFTLIHDHKDFMVQFPTWLPAVVLYGLAAAPWIRWRFGLRTLLIAITLAAVTLALVIYVSR